MMSSGTSYQHWILGGGWGAGADTEKLLRKTIRWVNTFFRGGVLDVSDAHLVETVETVGTTLETVTKTCRNCRNCTVLLQKSNSIYFS